jgi:CRISPR-associated protein (TIGR02710 family)
MMTTHLIITVGTGTAGRYSNLAQGLVNTLSLADPAAFWLITSAHPDSLGVADLILGEIPATLRSRFRSWGDTERFLTIENHDSLEETRSKVAELIRKIRQDHPDAAIVVNPTSGTKQMSAGATLAALDLASDRIEFTTGKRADGVVMTGSEQITPFHSARWMAERDASLAAQLWNSGFHGAAAAALRAAARHLVNGEDPFRHRLLGLALAADAFARKAAFQFTNAGKAFRDTRKHLKTDDAPELSPIRKLGDSCTKLAARCEQFSKAQNGNKNIVQLRELCAEVVDNALRAAAAGRYEDAACRLYRAMEMNLQIRLAESTQLAYWNGKLQTEATAPDALRADKFLKTIGRSELPSEFSLEQLARALHALGDASVASLCADLDTQMKSEFRKATRSRNASILAHGTTPVSSEDFHNLQQVAENFLGMSICETNSHPPFDTGCLEM